MSEGVSAVVGGRVSEKSQFDPDNGQPTTDNIRWLLLYSAVLIELTLLIVIFYAFTKAFS